MEEASEDGASQICFDPVWAAIPLLNNCLLRRSYTNRTGKTVETAGRGENKRLTE
jgi:hypothetical protein